MQPSHKSERIEVRRQNYKVRKYWSAAASNVIWAQMHNSENLMSISSDQIFVCADCNTTRAELGLWDNSARSWLRSADETMVKKQMQLQALRETVNTSTSICSSTCAKVSKLWTEAIAVVNDLLCGTIPRSSTDAIPPGLHSCHLSPDPMV